MMKDQIGRTRWVRLRTRGRARLRATGETSRRREPGVLEQLTAQELQVAQMAAQGLSNSEIGQKLYLSHRTIGSHLYRIYSKLRITSRSELDAVLKSTAAQAA